MAEKQIERIKQEIKKKRAALSAEKRRFGGFMDSGGRRYDIAFLYMQIADYKGAITYKRWFDKNFPDDIGNTVLSLVWSMSFFGLSKMTEAKIYTIDTAFQNIYLHGLLLDREVRRIDMYEKGYDMLEFAKSLQDDCKKVTSKSYLDWLSDFIVTDDYKKPVNQYIALNKLLKDEHDKNKRSKLLNYIWDLKEGNLQGKIS